MNYDINLYILLYAVLIVTLLGHDFWMVNIFGL